MKAAPVAAANRRFSEDRQVEHRRAAAALDQHEQRQQHDARRRGPTSTTGSSQPDRPPREIPSTSPVRPATNVSVPSGSKPRTLSGFASSCRMSRPTAQPASASGTLNQKTHCQRDRDERAAEHRADHEPDRGDHHVRAHRDAELLARERVGDERGGVREQERARRRPAGSATGSAACRRPRSRRRARRARRRRSRRRRRACGRTGPTGGPHVSTSTVEAIM